MSRIIYITKGWKLSKYIFGIHLFIKVGRKSKRIDLPFASKIWESFQSSNKYSNDAYSNLFFERYTSHIGLLEETLASQFDQTFGNETDFFLSC